MVVFSTMQKTSIIVPLIPEHDREVLRLLRYLRPQEDYISELIICRSETPEKQCPDVLRKYVRWAKKLNVNFSIELSSTPTKAYDGTNRNRGIDKATSDILICLDADDSYAENMIKIIVESFEKTNCDAILHNYTYELNQLSLVQSELPRFQYLAYPPEASLMDFSVPISTTNNIEKPQIHHAHISFRKSQVEERYTDIFPGADTEYCKRLIRNGKQVLYLDEKISFWNRKRSLRYKFRLAKIKFGLKK